MCGGRERGPGIKGKEWGQRTRGESEAGGNGGRERYRQADGQKSERRSDWAKGILLLKNQITQIRKTYFLTYVKCNQARLRVLFAQEISPRPHPDRLQPREKKKSSPHIGLSEAGSSMLRASVRNHKVNQQIYQPHFTFTEQARYCGVQANTCECTSLVEHLATCSMWLDGRAIVALKDKMIAISTAV